MLSDGTMTSAEIHSMLGTYEVWKIINQSGMDHPFHQHVNACQVLSISGGDAGIRVSLHDRAGLEGRGDHPEDGAARQSWCR